MWKSQKIRAKNLGKSGPKNVAILARQIVQILIVVKPFLRIRAVHEFVPEGRLIFLVKQATDPGDGQAGKDEAQHIKHQIDQEPGVSHASGRNVRKTQQNITSAEGSPKEADYH